MQFEIKTANKLTKRWKFIFAARFMLLNISQFISRILHPLLLPFYSVIFIFELNSYIRYVVSGPLQWVVLAIVFITTFLLPVLFALWLRHKGIISSLQLEHQEDRKIPYALTSVFFLMAFYFLKKLPVPSLIPVMMLGGSAVILTAYFLNLRWKVSIHMAGMGCAAALIWKLPGLLYLDLTFFFILAILLSGITGTARLFAGTHTPMQVYSGFIVGFSVQSFVLSHLLN